MVDDDAQLDLIRSASTGGDAPVRVCLDVDASLRIGPIHLGVRRSPLREPAAVAALAARARQRGFSVVGVMFYEARSPASPDTSAPIGWVKKASARELASRRGAVVAAVTDAVGALEIVNSGGTGVAGVSSADPVVTEVTAGSGLYVPTCSTATAPSVPIRRCSSHCRPCASRRRPSRPCSAADTSRRDLPEPPAFRHRSGPLVSNCSATKVPAKSRRRSPGRKPETSRSATAYGSVTPRPASCASASTACMWSKPTAPEPRFPPTAAKGSVSGRTGFGCENIWLARQPHERAQLHQSCGRARHVLRQRV